MLKVRLLEPLVFMQLAVCSKLGFFLFQNGNWVETAVNRSPS